MGHVAVVGGGIIGSSWAIVFARAGLDVRILTRRVEAAPSIISRIGEAAERALPIAPSTPVTTILSRISVLTDPEAVLGGADFAIEALEEDLEAKKRAFREMDHLVSDDVILASSTSSFGVSRFAADLPGRNRCVVAHPAAPPHLIPVVEVVPALFTALETVETTFEFMKAIGQTPVLVRREQPGFVMNRLQGALLIEMFRTIEEGLMTAEDVDRLISDGFGLRWAFLGPLEGIDLNAPGGIADYLKRYGFMFDDLARERGMATPVVTQGLVATLADELRGELPLSDLPLKLAWRDASMAGLRALRRMEGPFVAPPPVED